MTIAPQDFTPAAEFDPTAAQARENLAANSDARAQLRRKVDKTELRLAARDLAEGLRGVIRVSPLISVAVAMALGATWARRGKRRPPVLRV